MADAVAALPRDFRQDALPFPLIKDKRKGQSGIFSLKDKKLFEGSINI
jgi:hypothetical protein